MTTSRSRLRTEPPGALIAALPAVLGFVPEQSLVLVSSDARRLGAVMRVDLRRRVADDAERLAEVVAAARPDAVIAVIVDAEGALCPMCNEDLPAAGRDVDRRAALHDIELLGRARRRPLAAGGRWHCVDGCGAHGSVEDPSVVAAGGRGGARRAPALRPPRRSADGHRDRRTRTARRPWPGDQRPPTAGRVERTDDPHRRATSKVAMAIDARQPGRRRCAAVATPSWPSWRYALTDITARDTLYALAVGRDAGEAETLWAIWPQPPDRRGGSKRLCCLRFRPMPAVTVRWRGFRWTRRCAATPSIGWRECSTPRCSRACVPNRSGELAVTGYRLAERLGVRLPPRRSYGRRAGRRLSDLLDLDGVRHLVRQVDILVAGHDDDHAAESGSSATVTRALGTTPASLSRAISIVSPCTCSVS